MTIGSARAFAPPTSWKLWAMVVPALIAAGATIAIPGPGSPMAAQATVLAVGALALLAGHTWGLPVMVASHTILAGHLWPMLALGQSMPPGGTYGTAAIAIVLLTALPTLVLTAVLLPSMVRFLLDEPSPRTHAVGTAGAALFLVAALVLPAL